MSEGAKEKPKVKLPADFDLAAYAEQYKPHAKLQRLLFVADSAEGLAPKAFELALQELSKGGDTKMYKAVSEKAGKPVDAKWIQDSEKEAVAKKEELDAALNVAKTNLVKDDIRVAHTALGDFYYRRNDLSSALKCYVRTRDYCSSSQHIIEMCLNVILTSIEQGNFAHVLNYVSKAEQTPDLNTQRDVVAKLRIASGLAHLQNRKYKAAARAFLDAAGDMGTSSVWPEVVSPADVGLYAAVCALAQFDRNELRRLVINNAKFKGFLDLVPEVGAVLSHFYNCKYTEALQGLERLRPRLATDIYMAEHVQQLARQIRNKAIIQFFYPYSSVDLKMMAAAFSTTVAELEQELKNLIVEDAIQARIDSFNQVLVAKRADQRTLMFKKANEAGRVYTDNTKDMLLRMDLILNEFVVKPVRRDGGGGGGGGGGGKGKHKQ